ncbi:pilin [Luteimonas sp. SDU101]|uniref:pilin n=1 Tax=Luteimonas sp. SDU101 TaxID=3422593 RepID=UPI003EB99C9E
MKNVRKLQQGFTLIELMIVIAILGILIAIALPAYNDYSIRAKNSECLNVAASPKLAIAETYQSNGNQWPADFAAAGYVPSTTDYCGQATYVANGVFTIASTSATGGAVTFRFTPTAAGTAAINWACALDAGSPNHVPAECRGAGAGATSGGSNSGG